MGTPNRPENLPLTENAPALTDWTITERPAVQVKKTYWQKIQDLFQVQWLLDIAAATVGLWDDRGNFDASVNAYPSSGGSGTAGAILKGDIWTISVAGTLPTGQVVEVGDTVRALTNTPGNTQANWAINQNNIGYVPENAANKDTDSTFAANSNTKYPSQKAVVDGIQGGKLLYAPSTSAANTYTANLSPAITAYTAGMVYFVKFTNANTGAATINFNGVGAIAMKKNGATALASGDIPAGAMVALLYDGTNFQVIGVNTSTAGLVPYMGAVTDVILGDTNLLQAYQIICGAYGLGDYMHIWDNSGITEFEGFGSMANIMRFTTSVLSLLKSGKQFTTTIDVSGNITFDLSHGTTYTFNESIIARIRPRTLVQNAPGATPSVNSDIVDFQHFTGLNAAITSMTTNLTGTPTENQPLLISFTDNGTGRAITWGASFENGPATLPTTTVASTRLDVGFRWNTVTSKWRCMAQG